MKQIPREDTTPERKLRSRIHGLGYRFRKHVASIPGSPDMVFPSICLAVFIDGDFWHGRRKFLSDAAQTANPVQTTGILGVKQGLPVDDV
jgi:DNA mismatch endonuclease Vsr